MDRDERIILALLELADTMGYEFSPSRYVGYIRAFEGLDVDRVVWACVEAAKTCDYFPNPAVIRRLTEQAPRPQLPLNRPALPQGTYYENGSRKLAEILEMFDRWGTA
jgi:hypothetical protein